MISAGNKIPADVRLFNIINFKVDESILTGESKPVSKQTEQIDKKEIISNQKNIAFAGTYVVTGKAKGIVTTTGINTHLGHIATLVTQTEVSMTQQRLIIQSKLIIPLLNQIVLLLLHILTQIAKKPLKEQQNPLGQEQWM